MEMIDMSGYVAEEKLAIAKQYLVPQALKDSGLNHEQVTFLVELNFVIHKFYLLLLFYPPPVLFFRSLSCTCPCHLILLARVTISTVGVFPTLLGSF
jgi:hypothetical protein